MNPRLLALDVLERGRKHLQPGAASGGDFFRRELQEVFGRYGFLQRDRDFLTHLVYGVVRHRQTLDWLIEKISNCPIATIEERLIHILRLGYYQILFLERVPIYAAVDESVKLAKMVSPKSAGFVNAVLHRLVENIESFQPLQPEDVEGLHTLLIPHLERKVVFKQKLLPHRRNRYLAYGMTYSLPLLLVKRWYQRYGKETLRSMCRESNAPKPLTLRINFLKTDFPTLSQELIRQGVAVHPAASDVIPAEAGIQKEWEEALLTEGVGDILQRDFFRQGWVTVQDLAAIAVGRFVNPQPGETVIDLCAGWGTKTTHLAERMKNQGRILALDVNEQKIQALQKETQRLGITIIHPCVNDINFLGVNVDINTRGQGADKVLLDVPCTNTGVLARRPEGRWHFSQERLEALQGLQRRFLEKAVGLVAPGGELIYSTCSVESEENEEQIRAFVSAHPTFELEDEQLILPEATHGGGYMAKCRRKG